MVKQIALALFFPLEDAFNQFNGCNFFKIVLSTTSLELMAQQQVLRLGLGLNIQRSDGRIHSAVVSGLNEDQQSITVEWFEGGETKGKEVPVVIHYFI